MKTITFYNEKGGVGKSTFSIMFASYLHYKMGARAALADFDSRDAEFRKREIENEQKAIDEETNPEAKRTMTEALNAKKRSSYRIHTAYPAALAAFNEDPSYPGIEDMSYARWLKKIITEEEEKGTDVLVVDLPGSKEANQPTALMANNLLSLIVMPIERDLQAMTAALYTIEEEIGALKDEGIPQNVIGFFNKVNLFYEKKPAYEKTMRLLKEKHGLRMLPDMITNSPNLTALKDFNNIIRSTMKYPLWDKKNTRAEDPGTDNLFLDVMKALDEAPNVRGTQPTYLKEYYRGAVKKEDGASNVRQMKGSAFPKMEPDWLPSDWNDTFQQAHKTKDELMKSKEDDGGEEDADDGEKTPSNVGNIRNRKVRELKKKAEEESRRQTESTGAGEEPTDESAAPERTDAPAEAGQSADEQDKDDDFEPVIPTGKGNEDDL